MLRQKIGDAALEEIDIAEGAELPEGEGGDAPIVRMVSMLLLEAHKLGASDIHLEPLEKSFRVRFRIDGVLQEMQSPPKKLQSAIISRLKIMTGSMSIAEKRLPQDGRIQVKMGRKSIDLRVSTVPTNHGESMVMRLLDKTEPAPRPARAGIPQRRPGSFRAPPPRPRRHPARHRPDRLRQNEHALRLPQLHQQTRSQDHHRRGAGRISDERDQPGAGEPRDRHDLSRPRSVPSCARRRTSS